MRLFVFDLYHEIVFITFDLYHEIVFYFYFYFANITVFFIYTTRQIPINQFPRFIERLKRNLRGRFLTATYSGHMYSFRHQT